MSRETIRTLDDANVAVNDEKALRVQPPAPGATRYYWIENGAWRFAKAGWNTAQATNADNVRPKIKRQIERQEGRDRNDLLTAVPRERVGVEL